MTINSTNRKAGPFLGDGAAKEFPFPFKVFSPADVLVVRTDANGTESVLTLNSHYTMRKLTDQNVAPGGAVTLKVPLAVGQTLTLGSQVANLQPVDITNLGGNYPSVINGALDRATVQIQQLAEQVDRAMKAAFSSQAGVSLSMPAPVANRLLGWNTEGTALVNQNPGALVTDNSAAVDSRVTELIADLSSPADGLGASGIGLHDAGGKWDAENLEELAGEVDSRLSAAEEGIASLGERLEPLESIPRTSDPWTPALVGFGVGGVVAVSGRFARFGNIVVWSVVIDPTLGYVSSVFGTSFLDGFPFLPAIPAAAVVVFDNSGVAGNALLTADGRIKFPTFGNQNQPVYVSGIAIVP